MVRGSRCVHREYHADSLLPVNVRQQKLEKIIDGVEI